MYGLDLAWPEPVESSDCEEPPPPDSGPPVAAEPPEPLLARSSFAMAALEDSARAPVMADMAGMFSIGVFDLAVCFRKKDVWTGTADT